MTVYLAEYKNNIDRYMRFALIEDVKIINESHDLVWILSCPKRENWIGKQILRFWSLAAGS